MPSSVITGIVFAGLTSRNFLFDRCSFFRVFILMKVKFWPEILRTDRIARVSELV